MSEKKCAPGCKKYEGGEIRHHPSCPYYKESFSKQYDDLVLKLEAIRNELPHNASSFLFGVDASETYKKIRSIIDE